MKKLTNGMKWILPSIYSLCILFCLSCQTESSNTQTVDNRDRGGNPIIEGITQRIEAEPNNAEYYAARAQAYVDLEGFDEAIADLKKAIEIDSTNTEFYTELADVQLNYYRSLDAIETLRAGIKRVPDDKPLRIKLSELLFIVEKYKESMTELDLLLKKDPQYSDAYFWMGMNFEGEEDTTRAKLSYQKAVEFDSDHLRSYLRLGKLYSLEKDPVALQYYDNALRIDSMSLDAAFSKAYFFHQRGDLDQAITAYRNIINRNPQNSDALFNIGLIHMEQAEYEEAYKQFNLITRIEPTKAIAFYYRGEASELQGDTEAALEDYKQALNLEPRLQQARKARNRLMEVGQGK